MTDLYATTTQAIVDEFGVTRQRVEQVLEIALAKYRIVLELFELLGPRESAELFERLRGQGLHAFEAALRARQVRRAG